MVLLKEEFSLEGDFEVSKVHDKARVFCFLTTDQGAALSYSICLQATTISANVTMDNTSETVSLPLNAFFYRHYFDHAVSSQQ